MQVIELEVGAGCGFGLIWWRRALSSEGMQPEEGAQKFALKAC